MAHYTVFIASLILLIVFLIGASSLTAFNVALLLLGKFQAKEVLKSTIFFCKKCLLRDRWEKFHALVSVTKHFLYLLYAISAFLFLTLLFPVVEIHHGGYIFFIGIAIILIFMVIDFFTRLIAGSFAKATLRIIAPITSIYLLIFLVLSFPFLVLTMFLSKKLKPEEQARKSFVTKDKVIEMIKDSELSTALAISDQNTIASFLTFKEKVAREIMIPRVNVFALDAKTTIKEACNYLLEENYSRVPIFHDNLDNIMGVLMYKDLLKIITKSYDDTELLNNPIETIVKPVIYAPENKKISKLFQEFKSKKIHLGIIVNEYGGTEGIVTIEDILEEMVGEIKDEYDIGEDRQFWQLPSGSFVIDAKMSIIDVENQIKIKIPHSPEYETIGGYIFHIAGTIPSKGWKIHLEDFEIEVLISNERCIEKIRITTTSAKEK